MQGKKNVASNQILLVKMTNDKEKTKVETIFYFSGHFHNEKKNYNIFFSLSLSQGGIQIV